MTTISEIRSIDDVDVGGKSVLLRVDINSPLDKKGKIVNDNRIQKSLPTIRDLSDRGAKLCIIAHQGDTTDYDSLIGLGEHAKRLAIALGRPVEFIEDVAGPAAVDKIKSLGEGQILLLDNLRYLTEEASTFEDVVSLQPSEMTRCYLLRRLTPHIDCYVNDAFAAAHRSSPSMVAFQELLPSYAGQLLVKELTAIQAITEQAAEPCVFMLGGSRAGDAFGMISQALENKSASSFLLTGLIGQIFMLADGINIGEASEQYIRSKGFAPYIEKASGFLATDREKMIYPCDIAFEVGGKRTCSDLSAIDDSVVISDIGDESIGKYQELIARAGTLFVNGPPGIYENEIFEAGTRSLWQAVADADGFSVVGGGDSVTAFSRYVDMEKLGYVSTAGGALIRYLSGIELPLLTAMKREPSQSEKREFNAQV